MSRFGERLACSILLTVGILLLFDSRGVHLSVQGIIGLALATSGLAHLLLPDSRT